MYLYGEFKMGQWEARKLSAFGFKCLELVCDPVAIRLSLTFPILSNIKESLVVYGLVARGKGFWAAHYVCVFKANTCDASRRPEFISWDTLQIITLYTMMAMWVQHSRKNQYAT